MRSALTASLLLWSACGPPAKPPPVDAGPDTSCGLDCVAQARYGLVVDRCFEYSTTASAKHDPPDLGAQVLPVFTLEGGTQVLPVEYRQFGMLKMIDSFTIKGGDLYLVRREFITSSKSVTYKDEALKLVGVKWLTMTSAADQNEPSTVTGFLVGSSGAGTNDATQYTVSTFAGTTADLHTALTDYPAGLKLVFGETPPHGADARRVYVPEVGFVGLVTALDLTGPTQTLSVQRIRDLGTPDAGAEACSQGVP